MKNVGADKETVVARENSNDSCSSKKWSGAGQPGRPVGMGKKRGKSVDKPERGKKREPLDSSKQLKRKDQLKRLERMKRL